MRANATIRSKQDKCPNDSTKKQNDRNNDPAGPSARAGQLGGLHGSVQRLEARFGLERLPALDLFDGVLGAFQADIVMLPVDLDGADLITGFEPGLHFLQCPG